MNRSRSASNADDGWPQPGWFNITEVPLTDRLAEAPERFTLTPSYGGLPSWRIAYTILKFEQT